MPKQKRHLELYKSKHLAFHKQQLEQPHSATEATTFRFRNSKWVGIGLILTMALFWSLWRLLNYSLWPSEKQLIHTHAPWEPPAQAETISRDAYLLKFNQTTKMADWVAFKIHPTTSPAPVVKGLDPELTSFNQNMRDFCRPSSNFECAPLVPYSLVNGWKDADISVGYQSLITPQTETLNHSYMRRLDNKARKRYAIKTGTSNVWVAIGPVFKYPIPFVKDWKIPSHYFFALFWESIDHSYKLECFLVPQFQQNLALSDMQISLENLEEYLGYTFVNNSKWREASEN